jgi:hypothetical protein
MPGSNTKSKGLTVGIRSSEASSRPSELDSPSSSSSSSEPSLSLLLETDAKGGISASVSLSNIKGRGQSSAR